jgi:hypothetical protein
MVNATNGAIRLSPGTIARVWRSDLSSCVGTLLFPAMVDITIHGDRVSFRVEGLHQLWAFRGELDIPLAHIIGVEADPEQVGTWWHGFKLIGTDVPGLFAAGTFFYHGELVFWDVRHPEQTIIVSLAHERYQKLIVEVENPTTTAALLRDAVERAKT